MTDERALARRGEAPSSLAIVAIGCRYPGGIRSADDLWSALLDQVDSVREVPPERWSLERFYDPEPRAPGKMYVKEAAFLDEDIWAFDAEYFDMAPLEAEMLDPQQSLLLQVTVEALERANITKASLGEGKTGVYVGSFTADNFLDHYSSSLKQRAISSQSHTSGVATMLSARIAYILGLRGTCLSVDTACSSSLVAFHLACQALQHGEIDRALVGGVNVMFRPEYSMTMCHGGFLARDGRCKTFDARADGYGRGEGAGVVLLEPESRARAEGHEIIALVRGTGSNHDGRTNGITVPSRRAQLALMREVAARCGVDPVQIGYAEAHGTGTAVGDPKEAASLGEFLAGNGRRSHPYYVGSVKTNIGHQEAGAGIAGVIKAALCLKHGEVPPNLHFETPNPNIDFERWGLRVPTRREKLEGAFACVNSFGFGGSNAHAILERAEPLPEPAPTKGDGLPLLLPLSARSASALRSRAGLYADALAGVSLLDLAHTSALYRDHEPFRAAVVAESPAVALESLRCIAAGEPCPEVRVGRAGAGVDRRVVFLFTGMGPQSWGMGKQLFDNSSAFREAIDQVDEEFSKHAAWSLREVYDPGPEREPGKPMAEPRYAQPANFALQVALAAMWRSLGIEPDCIVGHSVGEIAAAHVAGSLSLQDAVRLTYVRSELQQALVDAGGMLAVELGPDDASSYLVGRESSLSLAALNSPSSVTFSGAFDDLQWLEQRLGAEGVHCTRLKVRVPYHSPLLERTEAEFREQLDSLAPASPRLSLCSTVTGTWITGAEQNCDYWWRNARQPVELQRALTEIARQGYRNFIEVGPHPVLGPAISECMFNASVQDAFSVETLHRKHPDTIQVLRSLAALYVRGVQPDWRAALPNGRAVSLPTYPWDTRRFTRFQTEPLNDRIYNPVHPLLQQRSLGAHPEWTSQLHERVFPWLPDHQIQDQPLLPGATYLEICAAVARELYDTKEAVCVRDVELHSTHPTDQSSELNVIVRGKRVEVFGKRFVDAQWDLRATASIGTAPLAPTIPAIAPEAATAGAEATYEPATIYERVQAAGFGFGETFRVIRKFYFKDGEVFGLLDASHLGDELEAYLVHPVVLDGIFQVLNSFYVKDGDGPATDQYLPVGVSELRLYRTKIRQCWLRCQLKEKTARRARLDIQVYDLEGQPIAEVIGYTARAVTARASGWAAQLEQGQLFYGIDWLPHEPARTEAAPGKWLVFDDEREITSRALGGLSCHRLEPSLQGDVDALRSRLAPLEGVALAGIAYGWSLDIPGARRVGKAVGSDDLATLLWLAQQRSFDPHRVQVLTLAPEPGSQPLVNAGSGALNGFVRTLNLERPGVRWRTVQLADPSLPSESVLKAVLDESEELEVKLSWAGCQVPRLGRFQQQQVPHLLPERVDNFGLQLGTPGVLASLKYHERQRLAPKADEIEVEIRASALNFKDLMKALGLLDLDYVDETYFGSTLGMEASGVVVRAGQDVRNLSVGDAVVMGVGDCFAKYAILPARYAFKKPSPLTFTEAVIPFINTLPAYYGLCKRAGLRRGERVLIHSASGGVGLVAIQIARMLGAEVYATAGNEEKQQYLRSLGVKWVSDSRSTRFCDDVLRWTGGKGVDVVLNVLAGELQQKSLDVLAFGGRFVELGKADILANRDLPLGIFNRNLSFHAVDFDQITTHQPDLVVSMMGEVLELYESGKLGPIATRVFPARDVVAAFEHMATSRHIGKLVIDMADSEGVQVVPRREPLPVVPDEHYLVTGGFSELGLEAAQWLIDRGARRLALVGRSGAKRAEDATRIARWRDAGIHVREARANISVAAEVEQLLSSLDGHLGGVMHLATVYRDGSIDELTRGDIDAVMGPKVLGARNLLEQSRQHPPAWLIAFSSVSAFGNQGQANYAAANGYLDALASAHAVSSTRVISINLGPLRAGEVERNPQLAAHFEHMGIEPMPTATLYAALQEACSLRAPQLAILDIDWERFVRANALASSSLFAELAGERGGGEAEGLRAELIGASAREQQLIAERYITSHLSAVLRLPPERISSDLRMDELGVDSLISVTLSNAIEADSQVALGSVRFMQKPTVAKLARDWLQAKLQAETREADPAPAQLAVLPPDSQLVTLKAAEKARTRLFCLPGTGSDARVFETWVQALGSEHELIGVNYPGSLRRAEHRPESIPVLAEELASEIFMQAEDAEIVVCGHSLGGTIAFETALALQSLGRSPRMLIVLAANPPSAHHVFGKDDMSLNLDYLERFGLRVDESIFQRDPQLKKALTQNLNNTRRLLSSYHREPDLEHRLDCVAYCVAGTNDRIVKLAEQGPWRAFAQHVELLSLDHGHFLLEHPELPPLISNLLARPREGALPPTGAAAHARRHSDGSR